MLPRLATPFERIRAHYDVVVVGSGYGGGIAASRLARAGRRVCLLERGRELRPGEFPDTQLEAAGEMQWDTPLGHAGSRTGLFEFHVDDEMNVLVGCGLGGTSLINANVSLRADPRVFEDECWPEGIRADAAGLELGYERAFEMLRPTPVPASAGRLRKLEALEVSARSLGGRFYRPPVNVTFVDGVNNVGVEQQACRHCGDCVTGCNFAAKNTTAMTYLADAVNHGAELYTETDVRRVEREGERWLVHYHRLETGRERFDAPTMFVSADIVVLGAGSLGSTEILLRSRDAGVPLSGRLGHGFTGNGDVLGFGYNNDTAINGVGFGAREGLEPVGPTIAGIIDLRDGPELEEGMVIEDGACPSALTTLLPQFLAASARVVGRDTDGGAADASREALRELDSLVRGARRGAVRNTQVYLVMAHDDGAGTMRLEDDRLRIDWPGVGDLPVFARIGRRLEEATAALGGTFVKNPLWSKLTGRDLVTVHPLGGCAMGESAEQGVVDHCGRVFAGDAGTELHDGLYVLDGSIVPRPLGVNPLLTIAALAERACALLAAERGWELDYAFRPVAPRLPEPAAAGLRFTERMAGTFTTADGRTGPMEFVLTIVSDDLERLLAEDEHRARLLGTVTAPALSPEPMTALGGEFQLFVEDETQAGTREMRYRLALTSEEGRVYRFHGHKVVRNDPGFDPWADTTTLHVTVYEGRDASGPVAGTGVLRIQPADFLRQLTTMQVTNAPSLRARLVGRARFGRFFAGILFDTYGGVFARGAAAAAEPARKRRELRAPAPAVVFPVTEDGARLRLTRYRGGDRGPVVLGHGLGTSSSIFALDTIETSLVELLVADGYDVWLLDARTSAALPPSATGAAATLDDLVRRDWPAALAAIAAETGAADVHVVAHCVGATAALGAVLAGTGGVRSVVALGAGTQLRRRPPSAGGCPEEACRRAALAFGVPYEHSRLSPATHAVAHELLTVPAAPLLEHVALIDRAGALVDAAGAGDDFRDLGRLSQAVTFVHGAESGVFEPEGTRRSFAALAERHDPGRLALHVLEGYGHLDLLLADSALTDVYPLVSGHLRRADGEDESALAAVAAAAEESG